MDRKSFPEYDSLPRHKESGKRSGWGVWDDSISGEKDHLGCKNPNHRWKPRITRTFPALNHLTPETKILASQEVQYGISLQLDMRNDRIKLPAFGRLGMKQKVIDYEHITNEFAHDDELSFNTQFGSQWDGFLHYADQKIGAYYNGVHHSEPPAVQSEVAGIHCRCPLLLKAESLSNLELTRLV
jgi:hypothetical protein